MSHVQEPSASSLAAAPPDRPWVILGCGYTGSRLARHLVTDGAQVWLTRQSAEAATAQARALGGGAIGRRLALDDPASLRELADWMPEGAWVVDSIPPGSREPDGERELVAIAARRHTRRLVYLSSTSVYPPGDGSWIDEEREVGPTSGRGTARLRAESALLEAARAQPLSAVSLRIVGIYGPGRGVHARLHKGTYRIVGDGQTYVNRVHVDDLVSAIVAAARAPELARAVYHVADDMPERTAIYAHAMAEIMGVPQPPMVPESEVAPWIVSMLRANRRVSNKRMKDELGVTLRYPSWREGLRQVLDEDQIPLPGAD